MAIESFLEKIEKRKKQLDEVLKAYGDFVEKLNQLPDDLATELKKDLGVNVPHNSPYVGSQSESVNRTMDGKTAIECAKMIITNNNNNPMHISEIAKIAIDHGYRGKTTTGTENEIKKRVAQSFWVAMRRSEEFKTVGRGMFCLREKGEPVITDGILFGDPEEKVEKKTHFQKIVELIRKKGKPLSSKEIFDELNMAPGAFSTVVYRTHPDFFKRIENHGILTWDLSEDGKVFVFN